MAAPRLKYTVKQSWGVGSVRLCAGFPGSLIFDGKNTSYCLPLGPQIVCWDIATRQRQVCLQAHSDLIICLLYNEHYEMVISMSYSGEIKLWDKGLKLLYSGRTSFGNAHFGCWADDGMKFVACGGPRGSSLVAVYKLDKNSDGTVRFRELWSHVGAPSTNDTSLEQEKKSATYINQTDGYVIAQFGSHGNVIALYERYHDNPSEVHLINLDGELLHSEILDPLGNPTSSIMCTTTSHNRCFAVGFQGGIFTVVNDDDLKMKAIFQATGSPQVAIWDGDYILAVSYLSGILSWWTPSGELVHEVDGAPTDSIMHLNWVANTCNKALWVAGIMSLSYVEFEYNNVNDKYPSKVHEKYRLKYHEVTGCGFDLNKDNLVASGDFTGNVFIWTMGQNDPLYKLKHDAAIRCLGWKDTNLFIGSLDGCILKWSPNISKTADVCIACAGGVLSLCWSHNHLAVGLDSGYLLVYGFSDEEHSDPTEILNIEAHHLNRDNAIMPAEVWSVCWSPSSNMIATASEDQTTCIWDAKNGNKLHTLRGHTTAVTSVDWKILQNGSNILATCADDRSVRMYNGTSFDIIRVMKLENVVGWFTLTYLSLNPISQQCLCSTQNGHLALWDCMTGELLICYKMHCGSIEGLAWSHDYREFGTVSSDCVVNVFSVNEMP